MPNAPANGNDARPRLSSAAEGPVPGEDGRDWWIAVVLVLLVGSGLTWAVTDTWAKDAAKDDQTRFGRGSANRQERLRDQLRLRGADLKRLAAVLTWAEPDLPALETEFRRLLVEDRLAQVTELGVLECQPDPGDAKQRLRPVRTVWRMRRSSPPGSAWLPAPGGELGELADEEHRRALRHLRPQNELALAVWPEAPDQPVLRLFVAVPPRVRGQGARPTRVIFGTIAVDALVRATFGAGEGQRGVRQALYWGNTNRPARISAATPLIQGVPAPANPQPAFHSVDALPLMGLPVFWELYSTPLFEQRGASARIRSLRVLGYVLTGLVAALIGIQGRSRSRHIANEWRLARLNAALRQEQEMRQWLTSNLHDGILQDLIATANFLPATRPQAESPPPEPARARAHLQATVEEIRRFMQLTEGRLPAGSTLPDLLREQVRRDALRHEATMVMEIPDVPLGDVPEATQFELWLAGREALANVVKHSEATQVVVRLARTDGWLTLNVTDDGQGFDPSGPMSAERRGLRNLRSRAATAGGEIRIESGPGQGTAVTLRVPVGAEAKPAGEGSS